jgi:hypothetical protein
LQNAAIQWVFLVDQSFFREEVDMATRKVGDKTFVFDSDDDAEDFDACMATWNNPEDCAEKCGGTDTTSQNPDEPK